MLARQSLTFASSALFYLFRFHDVVSANIDNIGKHFPSPYFNQRQERASREALSNADQNTDASKKSGAKTNSPKSIGEIGNARMDVGVSCSFRLLFLLITFS
jgi:hypothetical protein